MGYKRSSDHKPKSKSTSSRGVTFKQDLHLYKQTNRQQKESTNISPPQLAPERNPGRSSPANNKIPVGVGGDNSSKKRKANEEQNNVKLIQTPDKHRAQMFMLAVEQFCHNYQLPPTPAIPLPLSSTTIIATTPPTVTSLPTLLPPPTTQPTTQPPTQPTTQSTTQPATQPPTQPTTTQSTITPLTTPTLPMTTLPTTITPQPTTATTPQPTTITSQPTTTQLEVIEITTAPQLTTIQPTITTPTTTTLPLTSPQSPNTSSTLPTTSPLTATVTTTTQQTPLNTTTTTTTILSTTPNNTTEATVLPTTTTAGETTPKRPKVILAVSGSVATIKLPKLLEGLLEYAEVRVVMTQAAQTFYKKEQITNEGVKVYTDLDEWSSWHTVTDEVVHIEMRRWADLIIVAPLSANTLAKLAVGLSDNLLTCIARAWDFKKPFIVAPAMNTFMWDHPYTARHLDDIKKLGMIVIDPISKKLACGDVGLGAMEEAPKIVAFVRDALFKSSSESVAIGLLAGRHMLEIRQIFTDFGDLTL